MFGVEFGVRERIGVTGAEEGKEGENCEEREADVGEGTGEGLGERGEDGWEGTREDGEREEAGMLLIAICGGTKEAEEILFPKLFVVFVYSM